MSKNRDQRRKEQIAVKTKNESFRFQVRWNRDKRAPEIADDDAVANAEINVICEKDLSDGMLALADILDGVRNELGYEHEANRCTLNGSAVAYILGITPVKPDGGQCYNSPLADAGKINVPLQVDVYYDNECCNKVVNWVKERYKDMTARLGQPALKLRNMVVVFKRVVKS